MQFIPDCDFPPRHYAFDITGHVPGAPDRLTLAPPTHAQLTNAMYIKRPSEHDRQAAGLKPQERRHIKRRHLIFYLRVWELDGERPLGHVVDITAEGMMLISEQPIPTDQTYSLEVRLPNTEGSRDALRFRATCRWSSNDINTDFYDSGFEFIEKRHEDIETLRRLIEDYGFND